LYITGKGKLEKKLKIEKNISGQEEMAIRNHRWGTYLFSDHKIIENYLKI